MLTASQIRRIERVRRATPLDFPRVLRFERVRAALRSEGFALRARRGVKILTCLHCRQQWRWPVQWSYRAIHQRQCRNLPK